MTAVCLKVSDGFSLNANTGQIVNNITVERCNGYITTNDQTLDSWTIQQCYLGYLYLGQVQYTTGSTTNWVVNNCYIGQLAAETLSNTGQFNNDVFSSTEFGNGEYLVTNSIFLLYHSDDNNVVYQYSISNTDYGTNNPTGNGNQSLTGAVINANVFNGYNTQGNYSNDNAYSLKTK